MYWKETNKEIKISYMHQCTRNCSALFFSHPFLPQLFLYHGLFVSDRWSMMYLRPTPPSSTLKKKKKKKKKKKSLMLSNESPCCQLYLGTTFITYCEIFDKIFI